MSRHLALAGEDVNRICIRCYAHNPDRAIDRVERPRLDISSRQWEFDISHVKTIAYCVGSCGQPYAGWSGELGTYHKREESTRMSPRYESSLRSVPGWSESM